MKFSEYFIKRERIFIGLKKAIFLLTIVLIVAALTEWALRVTDPIGIEYFFDTNKYAASLVKNDVYAYIHPPGYSAKLQGVEVRINSHGLRGPEFKATKPKGTTRIIILGDSTVFGWGVDQNKIYPVLLQNEFNKGSQPIEVIPAGACSWNTRTEFEYFKSVALNYEPDILVVIIIDNDLEPRDNGHTEVSRELLLRCNSTATKPMSIASRFKNRIWRIAVARSYLCMYIQYYNKLRAVRVAQTAPLPCPAQWQDARAALEGFRLLCQKNNITLVAFLYGTEETSRTNPVLRLYGEHLQAMGVSAFPLLTEEMIARKYRNSPVDGHPNEAGHELIAQVLYNNLKPIVENRLKDAVKNK